MPPKISVDISRVETLLVLFVVALLCVYVCFFTSCFRVAPMHIEHSVREFVPVARNRAQAAATKPAAVAYVTTFALDRDFKIKSIRVVTLADWQAKGKNARDLWHLVADAKAGGAQPTRAIVYGGDVPGLIPYVPSMQPTPLEAGVTYHLVVDAGRVVGEHDFTITAQAAAAGR
jgi:hypothetical protein